MSMLLDEFLSEQDREEIRFIQDTTDNDDKAQTLEYIEDTLEELETDTPVVDFDFLLDQLKQHIKGNAGGQRIYQKLQELEEAMETMADCINYLLFAFHKAKETK